LFVLAAVNNPLFAQRKGVDNLIYFDDKPLHFGFYLGINTMDYRMSHFKDVYDNPLFQNPDNQIIRQFAEEGNYYENTKFRAEVYPPAPGFSVGGVANLRLNRDLDFRFTPGMVLGSRQLFYSIKFSKEVLNQLDAVDEKTYKTIPSAYINIPFGIRYKGFRHYNVRPYVYLGGAFMRDLENKRITESVIHLTKNDFYAEVSLGLDSYLEYFRFSGELRFSYGLNNIIRHDTDPSKPLPYYGYILKSVNSNIFTLIFYFE
jgi:hypothetical protein